MGELHLEIIRNRMQRDFNLRVKFHKPRVSYREKLVGEVRVVEDFHRQLPSGVIGFGLTLWARELSDQGAGIQVEHQLPPEALPKQMLQVLLDSVQKEAEAGGNFGHPIMGLQLVIEAVSFREGESSEVAIRTAAAEAFRRAVYAVASGAVDMPTKSAPIARKYRISAGVS